MNFSTWAIRQPTPSILLSFMLTLAGLFAFRGLGIQSLPDMNFPAVSVVASLPGATPTQLETEVVRPLEDQIANVSAIEHIDVTITDGTASLLIQFEYEKDIQEALDDVRDAVTRARTLLPDNLREPVISRFDTGMASAATYAVTSDVLDENELSWFVDDTLSKALRTVSGVQQIRRQGGVTREVLVELDTTRLQALNITAGEVSAQLRAMQQDAPSGRGDLGGQEQVVRTVGRVDTAEAIGAMALPFGNRRLQLDEIATVRDTVAERRQLSLLDGEPVVGFEVLRARGFDEVTVYNGVTAQLDEIRAKHPQIKIVEVVNRVDPVLNNYRESMRALYEGAILAVIVVMLFLRDWRATLISAIALPLSIIPTFAVMGLLGYTLNVLTLLAITLVIGILVDDTIVEIENIMRHLRNGKPPLRAAIDAVNEIGLAVVATTLTLVAVFLPTAFVGGLVGELFQQFGWTASVAVLFSLLVARLLTPMLAAHFLRPHADVPDGPIMLHYLAAVRWCLDRPGLTSVLAAAFFVGSMSMVAHVPTQFVPADDGTTIIFRIELPPGSTLEQTRAVGEAARQVAHQVPEVRRTYLTVGEGAAAGGRQMQTTASRVNAASLMLRLSPTEERSRSQQEIEAALAPLLATIPGARILLSGEAPGSQLIIALVGNEPASLESAALAVARDLRTIPGIGAVGSSASLLRPEIVIQPDFQRAAELGVTAEAIAQAMRVATSGDYDFNLARLNLPDRQIFVRVQLDARSRNDLDTLAQLRVRGSRGAVPLQSIADIRIEGGPTEIIRRDRSRSVTITADLQGIPTGDAMKYVDKFDSLANLPAGVRQVEFGDVETMREMFSGFALALLAGTFCVYAVMVLLFRDFGQPLTVLAALPLAAGGALGSLLIFGYSLSISSLIGLLMLIGIVTKNSILLVDYAIMARRELGLDRTEALIDACHKRARPIVMTTIAMAAGMVPMALGLGGGTEFRASMAVVVIGGLLTSTVLSLLVVPVVFELVDEMSVRLLRRRGSAPGPQPAG
ncbi:efflux RND transporter permease subunit [Methylibium sp.]|uniref:efflux RND transporter permease subunit n=1 Tax=Methylibium sp. TaxID=2067992 RepID=UPI00333EB40A